MESPKENKKYKRSMKKIIIIKKKHYLGTGQTLKRFNTAQRPQSKNANNNKNQRHQPPADFVW